MSVAVDERVRQLQQKVLGMQGAAISRTLPVVEPLAPLVTLHTGAVVSVDSVSLMLSLLAGPSQAGEWVAVVGLPHLGWEAAQQHGVDLTRTVAVPHPGEHWLSVAAALADVTTVVAVRPPTQVTDHQAARLAARLRQKDALVIAYGAWPRAGLRVSVTRPAWRGLGQGHGVLTGRAVTVTTASGAAPPRSAELLLPVADRGCDEIRHDAPPLSLVPEVDRLGQAV